MAKFIRNIGEFRIVETNRDFLVINTKGSYDNHAHFKHVDICETIVDLVKNNKIPRSHYLRCAAIRLTLNERYRDNIECKIERDKNKQRYHRPNQGMKK